MTHPIISSTKPLTPEVIEQWLDDPHLQDAQDGTLELLATVHHLMDINKEQKKELDDFVASIAKTLGFKDSDNIDRWLVDLDLSRLVDHLAELQATKAILEKKLEEHQERLLVVQESAWKVISDLVSVVVMRSK